MKIYLKEILKMVKEQIKLYVSEEEKGRLEVLAKMNSTSVSNYVRMTALGVRIRPPKEIPIIVEKDSVEEEDKLVLQELLERTQGKKDFITLDREFNMRLIAVAKRLLE
ncbi:plasmid mobilization protein [Bacillus sp. GMs2/2]